MELPAFAWRSVPGYKPWIPSRLLLRLGGSVHYSSLKTEANSNNSYDQCQKSYKLYPCDHWPHLLLEVNRSAKRGNSIHILPENNLVVKQNL